MTGRSDIEVRPDPADFGQLVREVRDFDVALSRSLRREFRQAADPAVKGVRRALLSGGPSKTGLRRGLAQGTKLSIKAGKRDAGIRITTTGAKLPASKQAMVRAFDKPSFRHPVPHANRWVTQSGRPYFAEQLDSERASMRAAAERALSDALSTVRTAEVNR